MKNKLILLILVGIILLTLNYYVSAKLLYGKSPIAYWKFNGSDGNVNDSMGNNAFNLTMINIVDFTKGKLGNATYNYNSSNFFINNNSNLYNFGRKSFTVAFWLNQSPVNFQYHRYILSNNRGDTAAGQMSIGFYQDAGVGIGKLYVNMRNLTLAGTFEDILIGRNNIEDSLWHRIVLVRDNSTYENNIRLYIDNVLEDSNNDSNINDYSPIVNSPSIHIGTTNLLNKYSINWTIDDIQISNFVWNVTNINYDWNSGVGREATETDYEGYLVENSQTYSPSVYENSLESFTISITYDSTYWASIVGNLVYNGTLYNGTHIIGSPPLDSNQALLNKKIIIPAVTETVNNTFYWLIKLTNSTGDYYFNSTFYNQTVKIPYLDNCTAYNNTIVNYTLKDEKTQTLINGVTYNSSIEIDLELYDLSGTVLFINYSTSFNSTSNARVCFDTTFINGTEYSMNVQTKYDADEYDPEYHYLQNYTLTNTTMGQNINLFDIKSSESTEFLVTYKGNTFLPVENAIVSLNRKYVSEGQYKSVEHVKTDLYGQGILHVDRDGIIYTITITKNGQLLSTFDNIAISCDDILTGDCNINLYDVESGTEPTDFYTYQNLDYTMEFNQTTKILRVDFTVIDNSVATLSVNATKFDGYMNTTLCSNQLTSSSGTLLCPVSTTYGNVSFVADLWKDGDLITSRIYTMTSGAVGIYGTNTVILLLMLFLTIPIMFVPSTIGVVIGIGVGLILSVALFFTSGLLIGAGGFLVWGIIVCIIAIWRLSKR